MTNSKRADHISRNNITTSLPRLQGLCLSKVLIRTLIYLNIIFFFLYCFIIQDSYCCGNEMSKGDKVRSLFRCSCLIAKATTCSPGRLDLFLENLKSKSIIFNFPAHKELQKMNSHLHP